VFAGAALFAALWIWSELNTWDRLVQSMNNRLIETARVIALHADDVFALASQPLTDLAEKAGAGLGDDAATQLVFDEMHRLKRTSPLLTNITYLGADGRLLSSTVAENVVGMDFASREYFVFHRNNVSSDIHIGTPSHSQKNDRWFMPISLRIKASIWGGRPHSS
jgi:hypothetical protein